MLDIFRNKGLGSVVTGAMIVATVLVFVIQFNPSAGKTSAKLSKTCAATVRGTCIEPKDHRATYSILIPVDPHTHERMVGRARSMHLADTILDGLVERQLLIEEASRLGLTVSDEEITDSIFNGWMRVSIPSDDPSLGYSMGVKDGFLFNPYEGKPLQFWHDPKTHDFDETIYKRNLKMMVDCSEIEYREWQGREILAQKMRDLVKAPVRVSDAESLESYLGEKSSAQVSSVELNPEFAIVFGEVPKDADVDAWAKEHDKDVQAAITARKTDLGAPVAGHLKHILIKVSPKASAGEKIAALERITRAVARVKHGETFSEVAKVVSMDDGSKPQGGDVGDKTDSFVTPFKVAGDALKAGEMTEKAIETQYGYHVLLRDDPSRLERDVKRELYVKSKAVDWAKDAAGKIQADTKSGKSLDDATKAYLATFKPLALLGVVHDPSLAAPESDAGSASDASSTMIGDGGAPLAIAKQEINPAGDIAAPHSIDSASFNQGADPIPALGAADNTKLLAFAFGTAKDGEVLPELLQGAQSTYVVVLKQHKQATPEEFKKDRDAYTETLLVRKQAEALATYVKRLKEASKAEVKIDDAYMAQFHGDAGPEETDEPQ